MHGLVGAARWGGVPLAPLLAGLVDAHAREIVFFGADHAEERLRGNRYPGRFARSLPVADALSPDVLLADTMNGEPLPREHGGPLRLIVPGFYGVSQVKWVERIEVWPSRFAGWFQAKDYVTVRGVETPSGILHTASAIGRMRLKSIVTPRRARVRRGPRDPRPRLERRRLLNLGGSKSAWTEVPSGPPHSCRPTTASSDSATSGPIGRRRPPENTASSPEPATPAACSPRRKRPPVTKPRLGKTTAR